MLLSRKMIWLPDYGINGTILFHFILFPDLIIIFIYVNYHFDKEGAIYDVYTATNVIIECCTDRGYI